MLAFKDNDSEQPVSAIKYTDAAFYDGTMPLQKQNLSYASKKRGFFSVAHHQQKMEFYVTGGDVHQARGLMRRQEWKSSALVEIYNFGANQWRNGPNLNVARRYHSSCSLRDHIYVIGGTNETDEYFGSIEILDMNIPRPQKWALLNQDVFSPRMSAAVIPINDTQFVIIGGFNNFGDGELKDSFVYMGNNSFRRVADIPQAGLCRSNVHIAAESTAFSFYIAEPRDGKQRLLMGFRPSSDQIVVFESFGK